MTLCVFGSGLHCALAQSIPVTGEAPETFRNILYRHGLSFFAYSGSAFHPGGNVALHQRLARAGFGTICSVPASAARNGSDRWPGPRTRGWRTWPNANQPDGDDCVGWVEERSDVTHAVRRSETSPRVALRCTRGCELTMRADPARAESCFGVALYAMTIRVAYTAPENVRLPVWFARQTSPAPLKSRLRCGAPSCPRRGVVVATPQPSPNRSAA
jgi:hypothetical protein